MRILPLVLVLGTAPVALAQNTPVIDTANPISGVMKASYERVKKFLIGAADLMPPADYAVKPAPDVRSFGQLVGHVAGAQYLICAAAMGEPPREEDEIERSRTSKAELLAALKASTEYCGRAYQQTDRAAQQGTKLFGQERTRLYALTLNATHNAEHYGNIVTYLRLNGIVPPSSRRGS